MRYLLDTSAILALYQREPGALRVQALLLDETNEVLISVLSLAELFRRLKSVVSASSFEELIANLQRATVSVFIDEAVVNCSNELFEAAAARLPLADSLIAACAAQENAILVHRDQHFESIPLAMLAREKLS